MIQKKLSIYLYALICLVFSLKADNVYAEIRNSPHDLFAWFNYSTVSSRQLGLCSICHIPHGGGTHFFMGRVKDTSNVYGMVAEICWKCHGNNLYLGRNEPVVYNEIFKTLDKNYTPVPGDMDSHPVRGTGSINKSDTLQNTYIPAKLKWPWTEGWDSGRAKKDIECTTCHNPHDWNSRWDTLSGKRKFLRVPIYYESGGIGYDFCVNCHFNKESDTAKNNIEAYCTTGAMIKIDTSMLRPLLDSTRLDAADIDKGGRAIWDSETASNIFLGTRLYKNNVTICQTCHMPHGAGKSNINNFYET